jgi:hypothetical protein
MAESSKVFITSVITVGTAIAVYLWYQAPLKTFRPLLETESHLPSQPVTARLWEDPLEAVERYVQANTSNGELGKVKFDIQGNSSDSLEVAKVTIPKSYRWKSEKVWKRDRHTEKAASKAQVLLVMTDGSRYQEGHENRLNDRYAVVSALSVARYVPRDEDHLSYFEWSYPAEASREAEGKSAVPHPERQNDKVTPPDHLRIPYEWYTRLDQSDDEPPVVVLWINNSAISPEPVKLLSQLIGELSNSNPLGLIEFKVIGPRFSDTYATMLDEEITGWPKPLSVSMYSPWATAAYAIREKRRGSVPAYLQFDYEVPQDSQLLEELLKELCRRGIDPSRDPIDLIGEWDTSYARLLTSNFIGAVKAWQLGASGVTCPHTFVNQPAPYTHEQFREASRIGEAALEIEVKNVVKFSYVRGLDGIAIGKANATRSEEDTEKATGPKGDKRERAQISTEYLELPEGQGQFDYVRRLAARIKRLHKPEQREPRAIGILGGDVYDELLILQALRKEFPSTLFFVTDLDARFFHDNQYDWTRNLIVASAFGLELTKDFQKDIPPFRSTYQTSTFFAVLRAIGYINEPRICIGIAGDGIAKHCQSLSYEIKNKPPFGAMIQPRLFEIGRRGPVNISVEGQGSSMALRSVHPLVPSHRPQNVSVPYGYRFVAIATVLCVALAITFRLTPTRLATATLVVILSLLGIWRFLPSDPLEVSFWFIAFATSVVGAAFVFLTVPALPLAVQSWNRVISEQFSEAGRVKPYVWGLLLVFVFIVPLILWLVVFMDGPEGEPFTLFSGVSTWPTIALRAIVVLLVTSFLGASFISIKKSNERLQDKFPSGGRSTLSCWQSIKWMWITADYDKKVSDWAGIEVRWRDYLAAGSWDFQRARILLMFGLYALLTFSLMGLFYAVGHYDIPIDPCRGPVNCFLGKLFLAPAVLLLVLLNLYVFDATRLCKAFIDGLIDDSRDENREIPPDIYLDIIDLIAERTKIIGPLVYCPFIAVSLMILSRYRFLDNWNFPWVLILIYGINAFLVFWSAYMLKRAADGARARAVKKLTMFLQQEGPHSKARWPLNRNHHYGAGAIEAMIDEIKGKSEGSFDHILQQPAVSASLLAILAAAEYYFTS